MAGGQILSDNTIGINMEGRKNGQYYSPIVAWDAENYSYTGLKVENGKIVTCPLEEADDFYFAVVQDIPVDDTLTTVPTIDNNQYGIIMKLIDFSTKKNSNTYNEQDTFLGSNTGGAVQTTVSGLLSTDLGDDGYPTNGNGKSMSELFAKAQEVNHLFIASTYSGSGYFEYDSTQNFASLDTTTGNFKVYQEIGTMDGDNKNSLKHGQFMPYNDLVAGVFASVNKQNLYNATLSGLPNEDPRKYEQMYLVSNPNYYFGMELEASFTQPPNGLDDWGHDIIYEFTGDDDFWLYVDGELIIDLGGIHSALAGSVNYSTGEVVVNGARTNLRTIFEDNYRGRNPEATDEEVVEYLNQYFEEGRTIFKDYTTHTMRIFYMERGAGASNLHMRFNLASVKPGTVQLTKVLSGVDTTESVLAEFPYQIIYMDEDNKEQFLTNQSPNSSTEIENYVYYKDTVTPVKYEQKVTIDGIEYKHVFFLKPGETAEISLPENAKQYKIIECGVNTQVYSKVSVNGEEIGGTSTDTDERKDFEIPFDTTDNRPKVSYSNDVNPDALRTLTFTKMLYHEDGTTPITADEDATTFAFRLYLATEFDKDLDNTPASMYIYHVKDPNGYYCAWDASVQRFVPIEGNIANYEDLTDEQKKAASLRTSTYGNISQIPVGYTVEVRDLLVGTQFKVVERPTEIPDGYSFQKYDYNNSVDAERDETDPDTVAWNGIRDTIVTGGEDPHVDIRNLKGWGLRVNKAWSDEDYMSDRETTYFAIYARVNNELKLITSPNTIRQLTYGQNTLYWYFLRLPYSIDIVSFDDYEIREVKLTDPVVDDNGYVTDYSTIELLDSGEELRLQGLQKGETERADFAYTVLYEKGTPEKDSNVRVDTVKNNRPGIVLKKTDWQGHPLAGATFTLTADDNIIGTFTSDETGLITVAFLSDNKYYTLTETKAPQYYHGLESSMTISLHEGNVSISDVEKEWYQLDEGEGKTPTLTIKNRPFTFKALKLDGETQKPMDGVTFELRREYTVDNVTQIETSPMVGYDMLKTDMDGVIAKVDNTLSAGTYELRENTTKAGYEKLNDHTQFTISPTGEITLGTHPDAVTLFEALKDDGTLEYVLTILNYKPKEFTFTKVWRDSGGNTNMPWPEGKSITVYILQGKGEDDSVPSTYATYNISKEDVAKLNTAIIDAEGNTNLPKLKFIENSNNSYTFKLENLPSTVQVDEKTVPYVYYVTERDAVDGYQSAKYYKGGTQVTDASRIGDGGTIANDQQGYVLPSTGASGTHLVYRLGTILMAFAGALLMMRLRRRVN